MQHAFPPPRRARTPDPPPGWVSIEPTDGPATPHLPLSNKMRHAFAMARHGSDDHHERRSESKLGFTALSGLAHSHTIGHSRRKPRPEHNGHAHHASHVEDEEHHEGSQAPSEVPRDHEHEHGQGISLLRLEDEPTKEHARAIHHKFASEGWPTEDDGGSKLGRRISTLRGGHGISSWRSVRKHVSAAAHAAAHSMRAPDLPYYAGGGRHPIRTNAPSPHVGSVAPDASTVDLSFVPGGGRHPQRSNYPASLAPSQPRSPQPSPPPPLPTSRPTYGRSTSNSSTYAFDNSSPSAHNHHTPSFASSSAPSVAPTTSAASDAGSDPGNYTVERRTSSARHHTLSHVRNSASSVHHYQPSEASLTSSPTSVISPLLPITPRSPYGPCRGGSPGKRTMSRTFRQPNIDEVLPFASSPFAAWDPAAIDAEVSGSVNSRNAKAAASAERSAKSSDGWRDLRAKGATGSRRVWHDAKGKGVCTVYKVGWERDVLDLESRLHETMYELAGGRHSFADGEPSTVLDVSC